MLEKWYVDHPPKAMPHEKKRERGNKITFGLPPQNLFPSSSSITYNWWIKAQNISLIQSTKNELNNPSYDRFELKNVYLASSTS